jgi:hypothetical protein
MKCALLTATVFAFSLSPAHAAPVTGADLADMCVKHEPRVSYYILGAVDAFNVRIGAPKRFCIPADADIPSTHLTNIVCEYVVAHTADQDRDAGVLVYRSLRDAYPCGARR